MSLLRGRIYNRSKKPAGGREGRSFSDGQNVHPKATAETLAEKHGLATAFVVSLNLHRRHLDESQRAKVAAKLANMPQGTRTDIQPSANLQNVSQSRAAELLNVSRRALQTA